MKLDIASLFPTDTDLSCLLPLDFSACNRRTFLVPNYIKIPVKEAPPSFLVSRFRRVTAEVCHF